MSTKVSESTGYTENFQMSALGYVMAAILVIVMLPLLPIFAVMWLIYRVFQSDEETEPIFASWRDREQQSDES